MYVAKLDVSSQLVKMYVEHSHLHVKAIVVDKDELVPWQTIASSFRKLLLNEKMSLTMMIRKVHFWCRVEMKLPISTLNNFFT